MKYVTTIERMAKQEGKIEERLEIAINMLKGNLPLEQVSQFTGLTIAQIQKLQSKMEDPI